MTGPLLRRTILLTRDEGLADELRALGAEVRVAAVTRTVPIPAAIDPAAFEWIVFTSPRAVAYSPFPPDAGPLVACVGPATARAVEERGGRVALMPARHDAEALCGALLAEGVGRGTRVLFSCSERALDTVERVLGEVGAEVARRPVYRTETAAALPPDGQAGVDVIVFLAPSAVEAFLALGGDLDAAPILVIGPTTAAAVRAAGVEPEVAPASDRKGLIEALTSREYQR